MYLMCVRELVAPCSLCVCFCVLVLAGVFAGCGRPSIAGVPGKMGYEDFIAFFMSEEDKTSEAALRYWFRVCDLDGDGLLTPDGT